MNDTTASFDLRDALNEIDTFTIILRDGINEFRARPSRYHAEHAELTARHLTERTQTLADALGKYGSGIVLK